MYPSPVFLMGDEHCTYLNQYKGCIPESQLFYPCTAGQQWDATAIVNYIPSYTLPIYTPWYVFSVGTWDGSHNRFSYYTQMRNWVNLSYQGPRRFPKCIWLAPVSNQGAAFNVIRCARSFRDQFVYLNSHSYPVAADGIHLTTPGYVTLSQQLRSMTRCWTL